MADQVSEAAKKAKAALAAKSPLVKRLSNEDYVSTGLTPLNLGLSDRVFGGLEKGHVYRLIGKSGTGKTFIGGSILCEASISPYFKDYELIHDDIEYGAKMDPRKFWAPLVSRLKSPLMGNWEPPKTLNEWYEQTQARLDKGKSFIEITDSLDALGEPNLEGKMSDGRAKTLSNLLRKLMSGIKATKSIVILVQHAKTNLGNTWAELVTTGGVSPEFYSTQDVWLGKCEKLMRKLPGKDVELQVGNMFQAHIKKNRGTGLDRTIRFPLYNDYGIDDVGACIWLLLEYEHWKKAADKDVQEDKQDEKKKKKRRSGMIEATEFGFTGFQADLVRKIEEDGKVRELQLLTGNVWRQVQAALNQNRKPKYGG